MVLKSMTQASSTSSLSSTRRSRSIDPAMTASFTGRSPETRHFVVPPAGIEPATRGLGAAMSSRCRSSLLRVEEQGPVDRVREVALERTASLAGSLSFGTFARQEQLRSVVSSGLGKRHCVQRSVQLTVPAAVQPVPDDRAPRGWDRSCAGVRGEGRRRGEPADVADLSQDLRGDERTDPADREQVRWRRLIEQGGDLAFESPISPRASGARPTAFGRSPNSTRARARRTSSSKGPALMTRSGRCCSSVAMTLGRPLARDE
jgi:hypothetical protein